MLANAKTAARWEEGFRSVLLHRVDNQCDAASLLHHLDALVHNHCSCLPLPVFVAHTCVAFPCARLRPTNDPSFLERTRLDRLDHNVVFVWWESERKKVSLTVVNVVVVSMAQTINGITPVSAASFALSTMPFVRLARAKHASYCTCETYLCRCMAAITREIPFAGAIDS